MRKVILIILMMSSIFGTNIIFNGELREKKLKFIGEDKKEKLLSAYVETNMFLSSKIKATKLSFSNDIASKKEALLKYNAEIALFVKHSSRTIIINLMSASGASQSVYITGKSNFSLENLEKDLNSKIQILMNYEEKGQ